MTNEYRCSLSTKLLNAQEKHPTNRTEEEINYLRGCGFNDPELVATAKHQTKIPRKRGRSGNKIRRLFYAIDEIPRPVALLCEQYGVSLNTVRQTRRFDYYPEIGQIVTKSINGISLIWRKRRVRVSIDMANQKVSHR